MMMILLYILACAWIANLFTWKLTWGFFLKFKKNYCDYQVFKCTPCFAFWFFLPPTFLILKTLYFTIIVCLVISLVSAIIEKNLNIWD